MAWNDVCGQWSRVRWGRIGSGTTLAVVLVCVALWMVGRTAPSPAAVELPLDVSPTSAAARAVDEDRSLTEAERDVLRRISTRPTAVWIPGPTRLAAEAVDRAVEGAADREAMATLVAYNIPGRDCGSHSASDETVEVDDYRAWVGEFVDGLGEHRAIVVLEPDALAQLDCLEPEDRQTRLSLLRYAVTAISDQGSFVYVDAGHSGWHDAEEMADRLRRAGVDEAAGFSLNVSNFRSTEDQVEYGTRISEALDVSTHFVIDTSRNGIPSDSGEWCNPWGRGLGVPPTLDTGIELVDGYLWIKHPGRSDGPCNGGPEAGTWWTDYALHLARNATPS
ncbi:glycoside hydrolase family 6 protein [Sanguibacter suaedae]|uniref:Glucanase n=1 Tax=Sanguibacter suaedae TaxID=2795737 RepID=A0A934IBR2_9MICO|nr:glycoside hydrolase family 6 protein [Sanguibacter suaedae]MBI9114870.1 glycoside hydrolase family 6 protein [Sanguibacter suaedae]